MPLEDSAILRENPVIKCESVYKIFGDNAEKMLQDAKGSVDAKVFQDAGCVVGVNSASFEVYKGEMLVVMGLSGSGKSTLLRCISRLTETTAGNIFIDGQDGDGFSKLCIITSQNGNREYCISFASEGKHYKG